MNDQVKRYFPNGIVVFFLVLMIGRINIKRNSAIGAAKNTNTPIVVPGINNHITIFPQGNRVITRHPAGKFFENIFRDFFSNRRWRVNPLVIRVVVQFGELFHRISKRISERLFLNRQTC